MSKTEHLVHGVTEESDPRRIYTARKKLGIFKFMENVKRFMIQWYYILKVWCLSRSGHYSSKTIFLKKFKGTWGQLTCSSLALAQTNCFGLDEEQNETMLACLKSLTHSFCLKFTSNVLVCLLYFHSSVFNSGLNMFRVEWNQKFITTGHGSSKRIIFLNQQEQRGKHLTILKWLLWIQPW